jgi:hypothetical protein
MEVIIPSKTDNNGIMHLLRLFEVLIPNQSDNDRIMLLLRLLK